jgi:CTP:molybdopterin cytidylyltransferase MocA
MDDVGGIVLAAGGSERMGRPKATLVWRRATFLDHVVAALARAGVAPIVVVTGAERPAVPPPAREVHHPGWVQGQMSSLQAGVRALATASPAPAGVLVAAVDRPRLDSSTVRDLLAAWRQAAHCVWQPRHGGRSGHPVVYPADVAARLAAAAPDATARDVLRSPAVADRRRWLDVNDPSVLDNVDTPEDLAALLLE